MVGFTSLAANFTAAGLGKSQITTNRTGLVAEFLFGRDLATSKVNSAGAKVAAAVFSNGTAVPPVYSDHRVSLGSGTGLDSGVAPVGAMTMLGIMQADVVDGAALSSGVFYFGATAADAGRAMLCTKTGGTSNPGFGLGGASGTIPLTNLPQRPLTDFRGMALRIGGIATGSAYAVDEMKAGVRVQGIAGTTTTDRGTLTGTIEIGATGNVGTGGSWDSKVNYAAAVFWNRYLTDGELLAAYQEVRAFLAPYVAC